MRRLHVIGRKNHGKTTLIVDLIQALTAQGLRIGTIKHTHHQHELDTPGKDSHRHRSAGAVCVGILSPQLNALFWPTDNAGAGDERYEAFASLQSTCDLVIVEGDTQATADKIEVWRAVVGSEPIAARDPSVLAVVSNDVVDLKCPVLNRDPPEELVQWILRRHQVT